MSFRRGLPTMHWLAGFAMMLVALWGTAGCTGVIEGAFDHSDDIGTDPGSTPDPQQIECQLGFAPCGLDCVRLESSQTHCGACDSPCASGEVCALGVCGVECLPPYTECGDECAHLDDDANHCGSCERSCSEGMPCFAGVCGCPEGTLICEGQCVDPNSNLAHCGDCGAPCEADEVCLAGACAAAADGCPFTACGAECVDTQVSAVHCGDCGRRCSSGQTCQNGSCECTNPDAVICDDRCVDLLSDVDHCGQCDSPCSGGYPCTDGECACPAGQELCSGSCVDTASAIAHCGSCGSACPEGQTCIVGQCSGSSGDDCSNVVASGVTIREIAVLQAGKISVMEAGEPVTERLADVVAGKNAVVRVYVDTEPGFSERVLSARLTFREGDTLSQVFHKRTVSDSSVESIWGSTFNIEVAGERVTSASQFLVEIVECGEAPSESSAAAQYPAVGMADLGARDLGRLQLRFIPIQPTNGSDPDVSAARLDAYAEYLSTMYPVEGVDYTVGSSLNLNYAINAGGGGWEEALDALRARHAQDNAENGLYYYGLFQPSSNNYCSGGCTAGIGYVPPTAGNNHRQYRVSLGLSSGTRGSAEVMAHEIGHNHGRPHSPCGGVSGADSNYPHSGAQIGWWGFEWSGTLHTPSSTDIMAYCSNKWVSDYVYRLLAERIAAINGSALFAGEEGPKFTWRVLLAGPRGPRWGLPLSQPTEAAGAPEPAVILDRAGNVVAEVTVYRTLTDHLNGSSILVPEPEPGWHAIVVRGEVPLPFGAVHSSLP